MCEEGKERKGKCYGFLGNSLGVNVSSMKNSTAAGLATVRPVLEFCSGQRNGLLTDFRHSCWLTCGRGARHTQSTDGQVSAIPLRKLVVAPEWSRSNSLAKASNAWWAVSVSGSRWKMVEQIPLLIVGTAHQMPGFAREWERTFYVANQVVIKLLISLLIRHPERLS